MNPKNNQLFNQLTLIWCCKETMFKWYGLGNIDFKTMLKVIEYNGHIHSTIKIDNTIISLPIMHIIFKKIILTFAHQ